jgi:hypothetical protein
MLISLRDKTQLASLYGCSLLEQIAFTWLTVHEISTKGLHWIRELYPFLTSSFPSLLQNNNEFLQEKGRVLLGDFFTFSYNHLKNSSEISTKMLMIRKSLIHIVKRYSLVFESIEGLLISLQWSDKQMISKVFSFRKAICFAY